MRAIIIIGALLITNIFHAQYKQAEVQKIGNYDEILKKENTRVEMKVFDKEEGKTSRTYELKDLRIPENKKVNIQYGSMVKNVKEARIPENLTTEFPSKEFKAIPEILYSKVKGREATVSYQIYFTSTSPFEFNHEQKQFNGKLGFVLVNASESDMDNKLEEPIYVEVESQEIGTISPKKLEIDHLSLPSSEIDLAEKSGLDSLKIKIITESNLDGYETYIPIKPTLNIQATEYKIMGFGAESTQLNVALKGSSVIDSVEVAFATDLIAPSKFILAANQTKQVMLRSGNRLGELNIQAIGRSSNAQDYESNILKMKFVFPWLFLIITFLAGLLGRIAYFRSEMDWRHSYLGMIDGLLAAVFFFFLKLSIPGISELPFLGAWIFGIAALGGYFRLSALFPFIRNLTASPEA